MRTKMVGRRIVPPIVLLVAGLTGAGCGGDSERLTSPTTLTASLSQSSLPVPYVWELTWAGNPTSCGASWYWQLSDSSWVLGGQPIGCSTEASPMSGTGTIPVNAIAIQVSAGVAAGECSDGSTIIKILNNQQNVSININSQLPNFTVYIDPFYGTKTKISCPTASGSFSLHT